MLLSFFALKRSVPSLNERDHIEIDFFRRLKHHRAYYRETPLDKKVSGFFLADPDTDQKFVVINNKLGAAEKLRSQFHEWAHLEIHSPIDDDLVLMFRSMETLARRAEITAEALSLVLMFSYPTLEKYIITGELPEHLFPCLKERLLILDYYGI